MDEKTQRGIDCLKEIFEAGNFFKLSDPRDLERNGFSYYFRISALEKEWDFCVTREVLADLPNAKEYQKAAADLATSLRQRFKNVSPLHFITAAGRLIRLEVNWPIRSLMPRTGSGVVVTVQDVQSKNETNLQLVLTHLQSVVELKSDPFAIHEALVNTIRRAVDANEVTFPSESSSEELPEIKLLFNAISPIDTTEEQFLKNKVRQMGFRSGNRDTAVWIADPWDADYLGKTRSTLQQAAEILEAQDFVVLDDSRQSARTGRHLLIEKESAPTKRTLKKDDVFDIYSKAAFMEELPKAFLESSKAEIPTSLVFIDLDHFKQANDQLGHNTGDKILEEAIASLKKAIGERGSCFRNGGDEFTVILPNFIAGEAFATAERVRSALQGIGKTPAFGGITGSIGVAESTAYSDSDQLLHAADSAMYAAKVTRNAVVLAKGSERPRSDKQTNSAAAFISNEPAIWVADLTIRRTYCLLRLRNDSEQAIRILGIQIRKSGVPLSPLIRANGTQSWELQARASLEINRELESIPAVTLTNMNRDRGTIFKTTIEFVARVMIGGTEKEALTSVSVQVNLSAHEVLKLP